MEQLMIEVGTNLLERLASSGDAKSLLMYSELLCPRFTFFEGSVLLEWVIDDEESQERFRRGIRAGMSKRDLEASFNTVEIGYLFNPPARNTTDEEDKIIAQRIASCWKGALMDRFPTKNFIVSIISPEEFGDTVALSFHES